MNSGPATINFNSLGAKTIKKLANQDLAAADIKAGQWVMLTYDGTYMQMQSQTANPASGGGAVSSVFGRSGAIVSQTGDYTAAQVTNAVDATASYSNPAWITALAYSKLSSAPTLGTAAAHAATDFQAALTSYSTIVGLWTTCSTGYLKYDGTCSTPSSGGVNWDAIGNPGGNLGLTMAARTSTFTHGATTGSSNLWTWTDTTNNTGTGYMHYVNLAAGSAMKPGYWAVNGNGVAVSNAGLFAKVGTGSVQADSLAAQYVDWSAGSGGASIANKPSIPAASSATPAIDGTGAAGSSANYARADHVHPTDTSRAASNASTTVNGQTCTLGSSCTIPTGTSTDILRFGICVTAGCGSETTINYIATMGSGSLTECAFNLATAATGSSVIVDVQDGSGTSIFGATKLVVTVANGTAVEYQSTFANSPQTYARGNKYKAVVTQNDSGGTAQGGTVQCR